MKEWKGAPLLSNHSVILTFKLLHSVQQCIYLVSYDYHKLTTIIYLREWTD